MDNRAPSMLVPTLIGGTAFGVASALPLVGVFNCACCSLFIGAGVLASYLYSKECRKSGVEFRAGGGALVGLVSGLFYAVSSAVVSGLLRLIVPTPDPEQMAEMMEQFGLPSETIDTAMRFMQGSTGFMGLILGFFLTLLLAAVFSTIGGLIGGALFKVLPPETPPGDSSEPPPPPPID